MLSKDQLSPFAIRDQMIRGFSELASNILGERIVLLWLPCHREKQRPFLIRVLILDGLRVRFGFEGWDGFSLGNAFLKIEAGVFSLYADETWTFSGGVRMCDEKFDFNHGVDPLTGEKYRTRFKEFLVKIGRRISGRDFVVHFLKDGGEGAPMDVRISSEDKKFP